MNEPVDHVDVLLGNLLADDVPDLIRNRLRAQLADFRTNLAENRPQQHAQSIGSIRRLWLGAAATAAAIAVIACVVALVLRPETSFAEVIAAVQRLPWIHVTITEPDGDKREVWYSGKDDISATRGKDWIEYFDHKLKVYFSYDIREKVLYRVPELTPRRADKYALIADTLSRMLGSAQPNEKPFGNLDFLGREGANMTLMDQSSKSVEEGGQRWLEYRLTVRHSQMNEPINLLLRVDPNTKLPHFCRIDGTWRDKPTSTEQQIDYPAKGPVDIYELGAPKTAKLVDRVPTDDVVRVIETMRAGRQRMDDYRAIVAGRTDDPSFPWWNNDFPMMFYRKGDKTRVDIARWTGQYPLVDKPAGDEDMEQWWRERAKDFTFCPLYITDGPIKYSINTNVNTDAKGTEKIVVESIEKRDTNQLPGDIIPPYYSRSPEYVCYPPLGIPQQSLEPIIDKSPGDGPAGSVLLRISRTGRVPGAPDTNPDRIRLPDVWRFWLDPRRGYAALRSDMIGNNEAGAETALASTVVEELKKSPRGVWYATRFRIKAVPPVEHDQVFDTFVDFNVDVPDSLFKPPTVGDVLH